MSISSLHEISPEHIMPVVGTIRLGEKVKAEKGMRPTATSYFVIKGETPDERTLIDSLGTNKPLELKIMFPYIKTSANNAEEGFKEWKNFIMKSNYTAFKGGSPTEGGSLVLKGDDYELSCRDAELYKKITGMNTPTKEMPSNGWIIKANEGETFDDMQSFQALLETKEIKLTTRIKFKVIGIDSNGVFVINTSSVSAVKMLNTYLQSLINSGSFPFMVSTIVSLKKTSIRKGDKKFTPTLLQFKRDPNWFQEANNLLLEQNAKKEAVLDLVQKLYGGTNGYSIGTGATAQMLDVGEEEYYEDIEDIEEYVEEEDIIDEAISIKDEIKKVRAEKKIDDKILLNMYNEAVKAHPEDELSQLKIVLENLNAYENGKENN